MARNSSKNRKTISTSKTLSKKYPNLLARKLRAALASCSRIGSIAHRSSLIELLGLRPVNGFRSVYRSLLERKAFGNRAQAFLRLESLEERALLTGVPVNLSLSEAAGTETGTTSITLTATADSAVAADETVTVDFAGSNINVGSDFSIGDDDGVAAGVQIKIASGSTS